MGSQAEGTACAEARGPRAFRPARGSPSPRCHRREGTEGGRVRPATPEVAGASWASRARRRPRPPRRLAQSHRQGRSAPGAGRRPLTRPERLLSPGLGRAPGRRLAARGQGCSSLPDRAELLSGVRSEVQHRRWKCSGRAHPTRPSNAPIGRAHAVEPRGSASPASRMLGAHAGPQLGKPGSTTDALRGVAVTGAVGSGGAPAALESVAPRVTSRGGDDSPQWEERFPPAANPKTPSGAIVAKHPGPSAAERTPGRGAPW